MPYEAPKHTLNQPSKYYFTSTRINKQINGQNRKYKTDLSRWKNLSITYKSGPKNQQQKAMLDYKLMRLCCDDQVIFGNYKGKTLPCRIFQSKLQMD